MQQHTVCRLCSACCPVIVEIEDGKLLGAEIKGDILKALVAKNVAKGKALYKKPAQRKSTLQQAESRQFG